MSEVFPQTGAALSSPALSKRRCVRHENREAAFLCPECRLAFCRECVNEYEGRFLCASCLEKLIAREHAENAARKGTGLTAAASVAVKRVLVIAASAAWLWLCFYCAGLLVRKLPQSVHEGTVWKKATNNAKQSTEDGP